MGAGRHPSTWTSAESFSLFLRSLSESRKALVEHLVCIYSRYAAARCRAPPSFYFFLVNACFVAGFRPGLPGSTRAQRALDHFAPFHVVLVSVLRESMFRRRLTSGAARLVPRAKGA